MLLLLLLLVVLTSSSPCSSCSRRVLLLPLAIIVPVPLPRARRRGLHHCLVQPEVEVARSFATLQELVVVVPSLLLPGVLDKRRAVAGRERSRACLSFSGGWGLGALAPVGERELRHAATSA